MVHRPLLLVLFIWAGAAHAGAVPHISALTNEQAWKVLPKAEEGGGQDLPAWIRALAGPLPKTAAVMIDLDYAQRVDSPLPPKFRAKLRWIAADANRCEYAMAYARADYVRAGGKADDIDGLLNNLAKLPEGERLALELVRDLTRAAYKVTDEQIARLVKIHGEKQLVAIVLVAAYANFQDRLLHGLGVTLEKDGPLSPVKVVFAKPATAKEKIKRTLSPKSAKPPVIPDKLDDPDWTAFSFAELQEKVQGQIHRPKARITIPQKLPDRPTRIQWTLLNHGYQPRLNTAWGGGLRAFKSETDLPEVEQETMFWVVTRSLQCFY